MVDAHLGKSPIRVRLLAIGSCFTELCKLRPLGLDFGPPLLGHGNIIGSPTLCYSADRQAK